MRSKDAPGPSGPKTGEIFKVGVGVHGRRASFVKRCIFGQFSQ